MAAARATSGHRLGQRLAGQVRVVQVADVRVDGAGPEAVGLQIRDVGGGVTGEGHRHVVGHIGDGPEVDLDGAEPFDDGQGFLERTEAEGDG